jgi:hypothetical protein
MDALLERDFIGRPVTPAEALLDPPVPLAVQDIYATMQALGVPASTILSVFSLFGDGLQTYEPRGKKK